MKRCGYIQPMLVVCVFIVVGAGWGCDVWSTSEDESSTEEVDTLSIAWKYEYQPIDGAPQTPPKVVDLSGSPLVLFSGDARLNALKAEDGVVKWTTSLSPKVELYCDGLIVDKTSAFCSHRFKALSWDLRTGEERWEFIPPDGSVSGREFYDLGYYGLGPNHFWGSGRGGRVFGVDRETGELVHEWKYGARTTGLTYRDSALYLGHYEESVEGQGYGAVVKVDATEGDTLWTFAPEYGAFITMRPMLHGGRVYAGTAAYSEKGVFVALDQETGEVIWRNKNVRVYWAIWAQTKNGPRIFVNDGRDMIALDPEDGDLLWRTDMEGGHSEAGLAYLDGYVYHPHGQGLRVVDAETGELVHIEWPDHGYFWEVGTGAGKVFAQDSGALYAFEPYSSE